ncbi:serine/threonine protein phosphatase [Vandammella animalimorsus]|uniref:Serine/threonine protein phosphatase n=1 Tax=Vandammella animalimorsus TaxID=2029117 RepID=A0A2A2A736_9BURK|nr:phosphatase PAP2/dual specificity phosphatase family protein [Vandammella animalimorsus]PAT33554.1 serine/threonine protein phosphatase [Vandammella animalimorsus]PAT39925.1 serine/threonine protein phosphatase [Vandammella animalimorsus]
MAHATATPNASTIRPPRPPGLWRQALWRLLALAVLFYTSYGLANYAAEQRALGHWGSQGVGSVVFDWERHIPLWPWTIVPYWSINLLYALSLFVCRSRQELLTHWRRLLTVQAVAIACFLLWPLRFAWQRPAIDGVFGLLFDALMGFDKPFNQAPSLHIALLVVLWLLYGRHLQAPWARWLLHGWFALIGLSVLTTWQHHFIDLPTGALLGLLAAWLWPMPPMAHTATGPAPSDAARRRLARRYLGGALACTALAALLTSLGQPAALWLLWPATALLLVAGHYARWGSAGFQKRPDGRHSTASRWLLAPYTLAAWLNRHWWTRRHPQPNAIAPGLWLGRMPARPGPELPPQCAALIDLCAELPCPRAVHRQLAHYTALPWLDLLIPTAEQCLQAADAIEAARRQAPGQAVLVCCALGYSRSAMAVAAWLLRYGHAASPAAAVARLQAARPQAVLHASHRAVLAQLAIELTNEPAIHPQPGACAHD